MRTRSATGTCVNVLWFASALIVLCGYVFVFRTGEARIEERHADTLRASAQARADESALAQRPQLEAERHRLYAAVRQVDLDANTTQLVARFVRDAARVAARHHAPIVAIVGSGPGSPSTNGTTPSSLAAGAGVSRSSANAAMPAVPLPLDPVVATVALDCTVEGRYADVLAALRELSSTRVLASVSLTSLARKNAEAADATVSAALHVVLERLAPRGLPDARTRPV